MECKFLEYKVEDGVGWIVINRPDQRNALNKETLFELIDAFQSLDNSSLAAFEHTANNSLQNGI